MFAGTEPLVGGHVVAVLRVAAPLSGVWLWLAPLPTLRGVEQAKTTGGLPPLPYYAMLANGWLWVSAPLAALSGHYRDRRREQD